MYDIRVVYANKQSEDRRNQNVCQISQVVFTGGGGGVGGGTAGGGATGGAAPGNINTTFEVVNGSSEVIYFLYVSSASAGNWGRDWLNSDVLRPGGRFRVAPGAASGCVYDVRVVFGDERSEERRSQDLCRIEEIVFKGPTGGAARGTPPPAAPRGGAGNAPGGNAGGRRVAVRRRVRRPRRAPSAPASS